MKPFTSTCRSLFSNASKLKPTTLPSLFKPRRSFSHGKPHSGPIVIKRSMLSAMGFGCLRLFHRLHRRVAAPSSPKVHRYRFIRKYSNAASNHSNATQMSKVWYAQCRDMLTTSTFSVVLGFWNGYHRRNRRADLWKNKVFLFPVDGNSVDNSTRDAMDWGVKNEKEAVERYKRITGREVSSLGFATHPEEKLQWLGASPDGLLEGSPGGGILEVKCPYNKGKPELGLPWSEVPFYYMPQVQGLMEILDRDWVDLYCWTPNGSTIFRISRDRRYWNLIKGMLHEFWWHNVIPARELLYQGREADVILYKPAPTHKLTRLVIDDSLKLAADSKLLCIETAGHVKFSSSCKLY